MDSAQASFDHSLSKLVLAYAMQNFAYLLDNRATYGVAYKDN
jgi:hypothetical protein